MTPAPVRREAARKEAAKKAAVKRARAEAVVSESVANLHPKACSDHADDGWRGARRRYRFSPTAGLGASPGRLPDHANPDVLPGRQPRGSDVFHHCAA